MNTCTTMYSTVSIILYDSKEDIICLNKDRIEKSSISTELETTYQCTSKPRERLWPKGSCHIVSSSRISNFEIQAAIHWSMSVPKQNKIAKIKYNS